MNRPSLSSTLLLALAALSCAGVAQAQILAGVSVAPAQVKPGEAVKATATLDVTGGLNCGLRVHWGDGKTDDFKINQAKDNPLVASHSYEKPGNYTVKAEPKTVGATLKCGGKNQETTVAVVAPPPPPAPAAPAPSAAAKPGKPASPCPAGWTLTKAGVNAKTKAFTCTAPANSKAPETKLACPGDLTYFENLKKGQLGCRP